MQLTLKGIQKKQDWNAANIALPSYSIEEIRKKTREKPVWVHFGAGNIGRGFIGETLAANGFGIDFVDVNDTIISALNQRGEYDIELAAPGQKKIHVENVDGINNGEHPEKVVEAIKTTDLVTTAIGPKILKFIAPLIADGIKARKDADNKQTLDVIACENRLVVRNILKKKFTAT